MELIVLGLWSRQSSDTMRRVEYNTATMRSLHRIRKLYDYQPDGRPSSAILPASLLTGATTSAVQALSDGLTVVKATKLFCLGIIINAVSSYDLTKVDLLRVLSVGRSKLGQCAE